MVCLHLSLLRVLLRYAETLLSFFFNENELEFFECMGGLIQAITSDLLLSRLLGAHSRIFLAMGHTLFAQKWACKWPN